MDKGGGVGSPIDLTCMVSLALHFMDLAWSTFEARSLGVEMAKSSSFGDCLGDRL